MTEFVLMFVAIASAVVALMAHRTVFALLCIFVSLSFAAVFIMNVAGVDLHPVLKYNLYALLFIVLVVSLCACVAHTAMKALIGVLFVGMICLYWYYIVPDYTEVKIDGEGYVCEYSRWDRMNGLEVRYHKKVGKVIIEHDFDYSEYYENESQWEECVAAKRYHDPKRRNVRY